MEMLQLYVVYDERLKPVDSNIGSFNRYNHKIDRINIEINEALPEHIFSLNVKRPDGTVNLMGYEVVQVDGTNYYFDVPAWVTEEDGLVEFSLVASTLSQVISFGKFYVDCIDTLQATAQATPDDPTFLSKVDKDLSTYEEVTAIANAFMFVDNDGEPEKIEIVSGDIETDVVLWTGGKIKSELDLKQDVITDNSIGNDLLAQMPTMTIKGNDTGATANAKDLTVVEVMELLSPSGTMEVPHNLKVYGNIEQVGGSYETHQEQVYTTKDHLILRDGAVSGLGVGSYAGLFAKLADGTNNAGLVFDGDGMARVGDIGTNLASPDFSQTQALATRQDTPVANGLAYWNDTLKRFDTDVLVTVATLRDHSLLTNRYLADQHTIGSITDLTTTLSGKAPLISPTFTNSAIGNVALTINTIQSTTAAMIDLYAYGTRRLYVDNDAGRVRTDGGMANLLNINQALIQPTSTGTVISRNIADTNPALKVNLANAGAVADILKLQYGGTDKVTINHLGYIYGTSLRSINGSSNGYFDISATGMLFKRDINDANPSVTFNNQQGTGNIANFQFGGANKLEVTKDGWLFQNGTRLLHTFSHPTGSTAIPDGKNTFLGQLAGNLTMGSTATASYQASYNVGVGYNVLQNMTLGFYNSAIGVEALYTNSQGSYNSALGMQSLYSNTTGNYNSGIGYYALRSNLTGSQNIALGRDAGRYYGSGTDALTTINNSVFLGVSARAGANSDTNEIVIGYNAIGKGSNTAVIGNTSLTDIYFGGSGTANIYFGAIKNQAIGDIPATINAITGTTANLLSLQVAGVEKAYIDKDGNGKMGKLWLELGTDNIAIGDDALDNLTTGSQNVAIGENAMQFITSGQDNVAIGHDSSLINQTGNNNVSVGYGSLYQNQTNNNTALGYSALGQITTGGDNVGVGYRAGVYYAGGVYLNSTGSQGVFLGADTKASANGNSNEIVIGYNALGNGSNTATIGNSSLTKLYAGSYEVDRVIKSSSISVSSWSADATYAGYGYRATITMTGATSSDSAEVVYGHDEAISGNYSPICETLTDGVYIYSKVNTTITVAQVIVHKA